MTERIKHILRGMASVMEIYPAATSRERLEKVRPFRTDSDALRADWERVGQSLWRALNREAHGQQEQAE